MYIDISFKLSTNTLSTNTKMNLIYISDIQKIENSDHIRFFLIFIIIIET